MYTYIDESFASSVRAIGARRGTPLVYQLRSSDASSLRRLVQPFRPTLVLVLASGASDLAFSNRTFNIFAHRRDPQ